MATSTVTFSNKTIDGDVNTIVDINETQMNVSVGAATTVLTSNGVGLAPTYAAPAGGEFTAGWTANHNNGGSTFALEDLLFADPTDDTKKIQTTLDGMTTGITAILDFNFTTAKTITFPDATDTLVGKATTDVLTNKTINTASNTITVVAADVSDLNTSTVTFTNKTIDGDVNTIIDINETQMNVSVGAATTVLTSNGVGLAPTYQTAAGGEFTGAWTANHNNGGSTFALEDALFADPTDDTKKLQIDLAGGTTGITAILDFNFTTAKTITFPDATGTIALTSDITGEANTHSSVGAGTTLVAATPKTGVNLNLVSISAGTGLQFAIASNNIGISIDSTIVTEIIANTYGAFLQDFSAATLRIPVSASPTIAVNGDIAIDTTITDFSTPLIRYFGTESMVVIAVPTAEIDTAPGDGNVLAYNATNDEFEFVAAGAGDALTSGTLAQFAATTSLQLKGVISDETGSGALVFATSPTLVTPVLGTPASGNLGNCTVIPMAQASGILPDANMPNLTGDVTTSEGAVATTITAGAVDDAMMNTTDDAMLASVTFVIDGGGSTITTGIKGDLEIPFNCTIERVTMLADQSGSIVVDICGEQYSLYPPTDADSLANAGTPPTITTDTDSQDSALTSWTTTITAGDTLRFNVDSITLIQRVSICLKVRKT